MYVQSVLHRVPCIREENSTSALAVCVTEESNHKSAPLHRRRYYASQECQPHGAFFYLFFCRLLDAERRFLMLLQIFSPAFLLETVGQQISFERSLVKGENSTWCLHTKHFSTLLANYGCYTVSKGEKSLRVFCSEIAGCSGKGFQANF